MSASMRRRHLNRFIKFLIFGFIYTITYLFISMLLSHPPVYNFVSDDLRIGDKYVLIYLIAKAPAISDPEGADIFKIRKCDYCFMTNNKGFLPTSEYDAIIHGDRNLLKDSAFMDPEKRYVMDTSEKCLQKKLMDCDREPVVTSFATQQSFSLCNLCRYLHHRRKGDESGFVIQMKLNEHDKSVQPIFDLKQTDSSLQVIKSQTPK